MILIVSAGHLSTNMIQCQERADGPTECSIDHQGSFSSRTVFLSIDSPNWNDGCCDTSAVLIIGCCFLVWSRNITKDHFNNEALKKNRLFHTHEVELVIRIRVRLWMTSFRKESVCNLPTECLHALFIDESRCSNLIKISRVVCCCTRAAHAITALTGKQWCFCCISRSGSDLGVLATVHLSLDHEGSGSNQFTKKTLQKGHEALDEIDFFPPCASTAPMSLFLERKDKKHIFR